MFRNLTNPPVLSAPAVLSEPIRPPRSALSAITGNFAAPVKTCVFWVLTLAMFLALTVFPVEAQAYPDRPIELSIVFSPGGALDFAARTLAKSVEAKFGQSIVPQNNPGGGGMIGVARLAAAKPDGYQLGVCVSNALIFIPHRNEAPYRPLRDVVPIISFGQAAPVLICRPDSAWADIDAFLAATRANPGELRIGVSGLGTPSHIALAMISKADPTLAWRFIPFGGPGEAETALLGGHVDAAASGVLPRILDGQFKPLLVLSGNGLPALGHIATLADKGFADPGQGDSTFVLLAPSGTSEDVLSVLESAFLQAAQSDEFAKAMRNYSVSPIVRDRRETAEFLRQAWEMETHILIELGLIEAPATQAE